MKKSLRALAGVLMMLVFASSVSAEVIAQQLNSDRYAVNSTRCDGKYDGTTFLTGAQAINLTSFKLKLGRYSSITSGYLTAKIKQVSGLQDELIQPPFLASSTNTVNIADIVYTSNNNVAYTDIVFNFANFPLNSNTYYAIVVTSTGYTTMCTDNLVVRTSSDVTGNAYPDGLFIQNSWTFQPLTTDLYFIVEGTSSPPPPPPPANLSLRLPFRDGEIWWVSQGNGQGGHIAANGMQYAWDFNWGIGEQDRGKSVLAPAAGTVVAMDDRCPDPEPFDTCNGGWGNYVIIDYGNNYYGKLAHLKTVNVQLNQQVVQGQVIGTTGSSGNILYGPHIHYQTQSGSGLWDPINSIFFFRRADQWRRSHRM